MDCRFAYGSYLRVYYSIWISEKQYKEARNNHQKQLSFWYVLAKKTIAGAGELNEIMFEIALV